MGRVKEVSPGSWLLVPDSALPEDGINLQQEEKRMSHDGASLHHDHPFPPLISGWLCSRRQRQVVEKDAKEAIAASASFLKAGDPTSENSPTSILGRTKQIQWTRKPNQCIYLRYKRKPHPAVKQIFLPTWSPLQDGGLIRLFISKQITGNNSATRTKFTNKIQQMMTFWH